MNTSLSAIAALVRSGGVERGWELFEEGGYGTRHDDSAALAVKGRLLKARARLAAGALRLQLLLEAANAYARANQLTPAPYLAINAASLQYQAGNRAEAMRIASAVIDLLDGSDPPADTPYFLAATRAEALLIQGKVHGASRAMAEAVRHDPDGWDDRAATLAQLREIVSAQGGSADWLLPFSPPASLHFAGHLGLSSGGRGERCLADQIEQFLQLHHFGFAWGALAAGCDIVIAEALLARGVSVHAVLPCPVEAFATQSVAPAGTDWLHRYHAVLERCASVRNAGSCGVGAHDPLATAFAGELAIGGALLNARRYQTAVHQLIVFDEARGGKNTARQAELWRAELGPQHYLVVERDAAVEVMFPDETPDPARQLALHVAIGIDGLAGDGNRHSSVIAARSSAVVSGLADLPIGAVRAQPGLWEFSCTDHARGLAAISSVLAASAASSEPRPAIGAHLGIAPIVRDPASGSLIAYGAAPTMARRLMQFAPRGVALASDPLAVTLAARGEQAVKTELYLPDEPDLNGAAHLLLPLG